MALTRKFLSALGIEGDKIDQIIEAHTETLEGLKSERDKFKEDADKYEDVKKKLDDLKAQNLDGYKEKYEKEHNAFEQYKTEQTAKETEAAKEKAVRAFFESKGITGKNLDIAMRGCSAEKAGIILDGDKIKDTTSLDALVNDTFAGLIQTTQTKGTNSINPPANVSGKKWQKADIIKIKDTDERQKAWAEYLTQERNN